MNFIFQDELDELVEELAEVETEIRRFEPEGEND